MAKQYIPGIGGLLTEPNPADSPSNTLSEAENVVIDQNGKVQARHGFNLTNNDKTDYVEVVDGIYPDTSVEFATQIIPIDNLKGTAQIESNLSFKLTDTIIFSSLNNEFQIGRAHV